MIDRINSIVCLLGLGLGIVFACIEKPHERLEVFEPAEHLDHNWDPLMFRPGKTVLKRTLVAVGVDLLPSQNAVYLQQARGLRPRKPAFSGIAKSKLFIVPEPKQYPEDEAVEVNRLEDRYKLLMRSISSFCVTENQSHASGSKLAEGAIEAEEAEWQQCLEKIKQWNAEIAEKRNERLAKERADKEAAIKETILEAETKRVERLKEIDEIVRREKELSKDYITPENVDSAIEKALEDKQDHNFAINFRGQKFVGRFVNASGVQESPDLKDVDDEPLPSLFQSSPIPSQSTSPK